MSIQNLILGSLVSKGADKLLNPAKYRENQFNILTGGGITGQGDDEETNKGPTTFGGIAKQGIMSLIAQAILGPVFGPLALTLGQKFVDKKRQGLGFFEKPDDPTIQPEDVRGTFTGEGMQFSDIQDTLGSMDSGTDINYNTGDITDKATGITTGNVYDEVALTGGSDDSGSNGGGGTTSSSDQGETSSDSGFSDSGSYEDFGTTYARGGLASLYR